MAIRLLDRVFPRSDQDRHSADMEVESAREVPRAQPSRRATNWSTVPKSSADDATNAIEYLLAFLAPTASALVAWYVTRTYDLPGTGLLVFLALAVLAYRLPPRPLKVAYSVGIVAILLPLLTPFRGSISTKAALGWWLSYSGVSGVVIYLLNRLSRQHEELHALEELKSKFIALANHELRTPVSVLHASLDILSRELAGRLEREEATFFQAALSSTGSLVRLIDMLTQFEALQHSPQPMNAKARPLGVTLDHTVQELADTFARNGVTCNVRLAPDAAERPVPETHLQIILDQLLTNAAKFNSPGGHANVDASIDSGDLVITVADDGWGIEPGAHDSVFESFYQPGEITNRVAGGLGLGLALVKVAVQRLDGTIEVRSRPGRGSEFVIRLPEPRLAGNNTVVS